MTQNLSTYHVFYTVARTGNISAASKALFISQPAVSKAIHRLEENLGVTLFNRGSRGVTLTHEGTILYERIQEAFHAIELGEEQLRFEINQDVSHLTIGVSTTLCKYLLLPYLKDFVRQNPHIRISIACQPTYQTLQALEEGNIDIGLVGEPDASFTHIFSKVQAISDTFVATQSYLDNLKIRTGVDYHTPTNSRQLFKDATLMLMDSNNLSRKYADQYILTNELQAANIIEVSTMDLLIEFAGVGLGIACVIKNFVEKEIKNGTLIEIPVPIIISKRNIGFVYRDKTFTNPAVQTFLDYYQQTRS